MSSVVIAGNTSGTITLDAPNIAGNTTLTLPATSGTVLTSASPQSSFPPNIAGNGPAFSAYNSSAQIISTNTWTKVSLTAEEFDTNNNFDSSTNYRFTPTVAGYYQFNGSVSWSTASNGLAVIVIYKNGANYKSGAQLVLNAGLGVAPVISTVVYLNGSTDYVELYTIQTSSGNLSTFAAGVAYVYFNGAMVRAA